MSNPGRTEKSRASSLRDEKLTKALGVMFWEMEQSVDDDGYLEGFKVRGPRYAGDEYMVVATRTSQEGAYEVGFCTGGDLAGVLTTFGNKLRNNSVKWVPDKYRE